MIRLCSDGRKNVNYNYGHSFAEEGLLHQRYKDIVFWGIAKATLPNYFLRRYVMSARPRNGCLSSASRLRSKIPYRFLEHRRQSGFREVEESVKGESRLYGSQVPPTSRATRPTCHTPCTLKHSSSYISLAH